MNVGDTGQPGAGPGWCACRPRLCRQCPCDHGCVLSLLGFRVLITAQGVTLERFKALWQPTKASRPGDKLLPGLSALKAANPARSEVSRCLATHSFIACCRPPRVTAAVPPGKCPRDPPWGRGLFQSVGSPRGGSSDHTEGRGGRAFSVEHGPLLPEAVPHARAVKGTATPAAGEGQGPQGPPARLPRGPRVAPGRLIPEQACSSCFQHILVGQ